MAERDVNHAPFPAVHRVEPEWLARMLHLLGSGVCAEPDLGNPQGTVIIRIERETGQRLSPRLLLLDSLQQVAAQLDSLPGRDLERKQTSDGGILRRLGKLLPGSA